MCIFYPVFVDWIFLEILVQVLVYYLLFYFIRWDTMEERSGEASGTVLTSNETTDLIELSLTAKALDLSGTKLTDSRVKLLCAGLENPLCKVENLW